MIARRAGARPAPDAPQPAEVSAPTYQIEHKPLAVVTDWHEFRRILRERCDQLNVSRVTLGAIGGFSDGEAGRLIGRDPPQGFGPVSFPAMLASLGIAVLIVEDAAALARIKGRLVPRNEQCVRAARKRWENRKRRRRRAARRTFKSVVVDE